MILVKTTSHRREKETNILNSLSRERERERKRAVDKIAILISSAKLKKFYKKYKKIEN